MINPAQLIRNRIGYAQVVRIPEPVQVVRFWFPDDYFIYKQRFLDCLVRLRRNQGLRLVDCIPECFTCFKCRNLSRGYLD